MRRPVMRSSTHRLADELLKRPEKPIRCITIGKFAIMWDGKPGDYMETVDTDEFFGQE